MCLDLNIVINVNALARSLLKNHRDAEDTEGGGRESFFQRREKGARLCAPTFS